ncbi:adenylyltransferase and sulfurtransferase MOCS3-2-like protein [Dinothrombium tinctorium]|uniref:Adenylyltransferase and sulfurtransferase MOCS3 homolog n=1 Tax=Dinothrombium tinctorium TaxID=1965070 RepID=A0A443QHW1_9ACAR|nr:adenylyltransferase and sulfurtransferase MOCS3-2-like protein [Dinothrombium tinctorium]
MSSILRPDEVSRYSRQMILPQIGSEAQTKLKNTSVLIVGCGGLGSPSSQYLVGAGIGKLGLVDGDVVETSNLHRQVIHTEKNVGKPKAESAFEFLRSLNSNVEFEKLQLRISRANAIDIIKRYDIVLDATDNAVTRYLLSDACVICEKPLVSGAALRFEGQLTVYNYDETTPCYRCLFPTPPPLGAITNCSEGGVIGPVPGMIGTLQALEVIKIAIGIRPSFAGRMLLFDGLDGIFRTVKIRGRKKDCASCGENPSITTDLIDYNEFCQTPACDNSGGQSLKILTPEERIFALEYKNIIDDGIKHVLIDVRPENEVNVVKLDQSINIPLKKIQSNEGLQKVKELIENSNADKLIVMCRRGNASQIAVRFLKENLKSDKVEIKDIIGGITAWSQQVDPKVPVY